MCFSEIEERPSEPRGPVVTVTIDCGSRRGSVRVQGGDLPLVAVLDLIDLVEGWRERHS